MVTMDASTYGRLVERGGYATGGIVYTAAEADDSHRRTRERIRHLLGAPSNDPAHWPSAQVREWGWLPDRVKGHA